VADNANFLPPSAAPAAGTSSKLVGSVVLYDGVCALCNWVVAFLVSRDQHDRLRFAALQSEFGRELARKHGGDPEALSSLVLVEEFATARERAYFRSQAVLRAVARLGGGWSSARALLFVPTFLSDLVYRAVAWSRYRLFGRYERCRLPEPHERHKFIAAE
jgi:predicted DCC family thiol-disulfide oxidoreductase YuxK